jgi:CheY-like chemotaxis protein
LVSQQSVLIVDPSEETREVLRTALEGRGVRILAASEPAAGRQLAREHRPDLIVLDLECDPGGETTAVDGPRPAQLVLLGSGRRPTGHLGAGEFVAKPYHYAPLIRKIESLLEAFQRSAA